MCTPATAGVRRACGNDGDGCAILVVGQRLSAARAELMIFWEQARSSRRPLPIHLTSGNNPASYGAVPEWLWSGLQNRLPRFNSGRRLQRNKRLSIRAKRAFEKSRRLDGAWHLAYVSEQPECQRCAQSDAASSAGWRSWPAALIRTPTRQRAARALRRWVSGRAIRGPAGAYRRSVPRD